MGIKFCVLHDKCSVKKSAFSEVVAEVQLKKYTSFLKDYAQQLNNIEHALGESVSDAWDMTLDPILLQVSYEILMYLNRIITFM